MDSAGYQNPAININSNVGNVIDSYKNVWNNCEISVSDERRRILEWLSLLASRGSHWVVSESRMDGVGDWLLQTGGFVKWHRGRGSGCQSCVILLWGSGGREDISRVCKSHLIEILCKAKFVNTSSLVIDTLFNSISEENVAVACVLRLLCL